MRSAIFCITCGEERKKNSHAKPGQCQKCKSVSQEKQLLKRIF